MADTATKIISVQLDAAKAVNGIIELSNAIDTNTKLMDANRKQVEANNAAVNSGAKSATAAAAENRKLVEANVELAEKTKVLAAERRVLQKEVQNEIKQQAAEEGSLKALRAELSNLTKQYDSLSRAERDNADVGGRLRKQINDITAEVKGAEYATERYYRNVGNYENAIKSAMFGNNQFAASLMALSSGAGMAGFSSMLAKAGTAVKAFGKALMGLMANPVFAILAGIVGVGMAFKGLFEYNKRIEEATRLTREFLGVQGDELVAIRSEIQAIADVYGKDFRDVLSTVDALVAQYGISAGEAMRVVRDGFQAGADLSGDFLAKVQQYAPAFNDAGIKADQLVAILQQTRSGIFSDRGLDMISKANQRIRQMTSSTRSALQSVGLDANAIIEQLNAGQINTFDVIQQISAKVAELPPQSQAVGEVMMNVFGRAAAEGGTKLVAELSKMSTDIEEIKKQTGEWGELNDTLVDKEQLLNQEFASLFDVSQKGFEELQKRALLFIKDGLIKIVRWAIECYNYFVDWYNESIALRSIISAFGAIFKSLWAIIKGVFQGIIAGAKAVIGIFDGLGDVIVGIVTFNGDKIGAGVQKIGDALVKGFKDNLASVKAVGAEVGNAFSDGLETAINSRMNKIDQKAVFSGGGDGSAGGGGVATSIGGKGGSNTGSGRSGNKGTSGGNTGKTDEEKAQEERNKRIAALVKQGGDIYRRSLEEQAKENTRAINLLANAERDAFFAQYGDREQYEGDAVKAYDAILADIEDRRVKALQEYYKRIKAEEVAAAERVKKEGEQLAQAILAGQEDGSASQLEWRLNVMKLQQQAELAELEANEDAKTNRREWWEAMRTAIIEKYRQQQTEIEQEYADKQKQIELNKLQASAQVFGAMAELVEGANESNKDALAVSKFLALGEIMISQAVAIANAVKAGSNAISPWQLIAQIATSITAVTVAMMQAFKTLDKAKFATGGYIRGAGTGTSDSIPIRVSNGESVMNANSTAMFGGLLSSLNQLGGGVPIQVQQSAASVRGEDMLARAFAKAVAAMPQPVVSVEDINRGQRQVQVVNNRAAL